MKRKALKLVVIVEYKKQCYQVVLDKQQELCIIDLIGQMHGDTIKLHDEPIERMSLVKKK